MSAARILVNLGANGGCVGDKVFQFLMAVVFEPFHERLPITLLSLAPLVLEDAQHADEQGEEAKRFHR